MIFNTPERVRELTRDDSFDRAPDGPPRVPDDLLEWITQVTNDDAWHLLSRRQGYHFRFAGDRFAPARTASWSAGR